MTSKYENHLQKLVLKCRRPVEHLLAGAYHSVFKGYGLEFDQIRDYQIGDDIRFIDWNSSAKMNKIMVKQLIEERDRTVILAIDVSASSNFSSKKELKKDLIAQVGASLAFIASNNKDRVGALFFSDKVEKWIPPMRGNLQVGKILEVLFSINPDNKTTNILEALKFLINLKKRNTVVFMLSDWIDDSEYSKILQLAICEYDFIGIRFLDERENNLPDVGLLELEDLESKKRYVIDTREKNKQKDLNLFLKTRLIEQKNLFDKYKIDFLDLTVGKSFINPLMNFFKQRIRRQI